MKTKYKFMNIITTYVSSAAIPSAAQPGTYET